MEIGSKQVGRFFQWFFLILLVGACGNDQPTVDVSGVQVDLQIKRFDQELFTTPPAAIAGKVPSWQSDYGRFFDLYTGHVLPLGGPKSPALADNLSRFVADQDIQAIHKMVEKDFSDFTPIHQELEQAFRYYKHYFPDKLIPEVITFESSFNYAIFALDSALCIGLDMYLGKDCSYYKEFGFAQYQINRMEPHRVAVEAMNGWLATEYPFDGVDKNMLEHIVHQGKVMHLATLMMPNQPLHEIFGYTPEQLAWCSANEMQMWAFLIDKKVLYSKKNSEIHKFTADGPFTSGFDKASPSRVGSWIGWRIVSAYMQANPKVSAQALMEETNAQGLLSRSSYKPER